ncbi:hypothetical protein NQ315_002779, partial [Exocentrus adspersus]
MGTTEMKKWKANKENAVGVMKTDAMGVVTVDAVGVVTADAMGVVTADAMGVVVADAVAYVVICHNTKCAFILKYFHFDKHPPAFTKPFRESFIFVVDKTGLHAPGIIQELVMRKKNRNKRLTQCKGVNKRGESTRTPVSRISTPKSESDQNLPMKHQNVPGTSVNPDVAVGIPSPAKKIKILQNILIKPPRKTQKPPNPLKGKTRIGYYSSEVQQKADSKPECRDGPVFFSVTQHVLQGMVA